MGDKVIAARIREAREYVGFTREDAATALGWTEAVLADLETGGCECVITGEQLRRLGRLYRRPLEWFRDESTYQPSADLMRKTENLTEGDREAVLDFAEWLAGAGSPAKPRRDRGAESHDDRQ